MTHVCVGLVIAEIHFLLLESFHEALRFGIVIRVTAPRHGSTQAMLGEGATILMCCILHAAVRVLDAARRWVARGNRRA